MRRSRQIPVEALVSWQQRLETLPVRSGMGRQLIDETARFYGVSSSNLYRTLRERDRRHPDAAHRSDRGKPRRMAAAEMERYCEIIAAMKGAHREQKRAASLDRAGA